MSTWSKEKLDIWLAEVSHIIRLLEVNFITRDEATELLNQLRGEMGLPKLKQFTFMRDAIDCATHCRMLGSREDES